MRRLFGLAAAASLVAWLPSLAQAKVLITVDLDTQTMHVQAKDKTYDWKVSSGAGGYDTPTGSYGVLWTDKDHKSDEYDGAPMPNAIFFKPGFAIHGAYKSNWGHPASHGCVRLPVAKSAILWDLVKTEGGAEITINGETPETRIADRPVAPVTRAARATPDGADDYYGYEPTAGYAAAPPPPAYNGYAAAPQRAYGGYAAAPQQGYGGDEQGYQQAAPSRDLYGSFY